MMPPFLFNDVPLKKYQSQALIQIDSSWPMTRGEVAMLPDTPINRKLVDAGYLVELVEEMPGTAGVA